jgi:hypothetical protein
VLVQVFCSRGGTEHTRRLSYLCNAFFILQELVGGREKEHRFVRELDWDDFCWTQVWSMGQKSKVMGIPGKSSLKVKWAFGSMKLQAMDLSSLGATAKPH